MISLDQYRALHEGAGLLDRRERGRILLRGADRKAYLHGLLSNDILALQPGTACYATLLTAQGRMISDMRVFELGDAILLDLERAVTPAVREHLDTFVITEDVTVEDITDTYAQLGLYGPAADAVLAAARLSPPAAPSFVLRSDDFGIEGMDLIVSAPFAAVVFSALVAAGAVQVSEATAEVTRIEAGIPRFLVDMDTSTIPLEAGIESRAISMTKGCYVGQEVIVRVLHRGGGRVAKKLVRLSAGGGGMRPDDRLFAAGREVGRVTSAIDSPRDGRRIGLGYVHRDFTDPGTTLTVQTSAGEDSVVVGMPS